MASLLKKVFLLAFSNFEFKLLLDPKTKEKLVDNRQASGPHQKLQNCKRKENKIVTQTCKTIALLAAFASGKSDPMQIALCHLIFNLSGIAVFYPIPITRLPLAMCKKLGSTTAR